MRFWLCALLAAAAVPAAAQIDLSGEWANIFDEDQPERIPGPEIGDYLGLPINDAARMRADTWDASLLTLPEHQCKPHPADYGPRGPANLRFWKTVDRATQRTIAWHTHISWMEPERTIWMDGRPHPPEWAPHTWQGFSTGVWQGDILTVTTTHLKAGWIRRNGVPRSDRATLIEHWIRHDDRLTLVSIIYDPVYLTEPFVRTTDWVLNPRFQMDPYPCEAVEEVDRPAGKIPHHQPGSNPFLEEFAKNHNLPPAAARGGALTMYPEYAGNPVPITAPAPAATPRLDPEDLHVWPVAGNVFVIVGAGANVAVQAGPDGVLLVDSKRTGGEQRLAEEIKKISGKPIRYIINTTAAADHTGGNEKLAAMGQTITGGNVAGFNAGFGATTIAHEKLVAHMSQAGAPAAAWPGDTFFTAAKDLYFNGEGIRVLHMPRAITDGDSVVYFRKSDVVAVGDIFTPYEYPRIDLARGGSIHGVVEALNRILDITIPADKQEGGTMIISGHGRICDEADLVEYRDMVTIVRDRIQGMIARGMTLEQVQAARPTMDYDPLYGPGAAFVQAVYRSLMAR